MLAFSYLRMLSRTILFALYFNYNAKRKSKVNYHGQTKLTIDYPKFKGGDATVKEMKADQNYNYVAKIFDTMVSTPRAKRKTIENELKDEVPDDLHTMLDKKENKEKAKDKYLARKDRNTAICPPTCTLHSLQILNCERY